MNAWLSETEGQALGFNDRKINSAMHRRETEGFVHKIETSSLNDM